MCPVISEKSNFIFTIWHLRGEPCSSVAEDACSCGFFSTVKCENVLTVTLSSFFSHHVVPVRWRRARRRKNWQRQLRSVMEVTSLTSSRCTQRGPPSPTWAPLGLGVLHPSTPAQLTSHYCSFCSFLPLSAGGKAEDTVKAHSNTNMCTHSHTMDMPTTTGWLL